jgi:hypothetical protein
MLVKSISVHIIACIVLRSLECQRDELLKYGFET